MKTLCYFVFIFIQCKYKSQPQTQRDEECLPVDTVEVTADTDMVHPN
jgi:hypothetical protein